MSNEMMMTLNDNKYQNNFRITIQSDQDLQILKKRWANRNIAPQKLPIIFSDVDGNYKQQDIPKSFYAYERFMKKHISQIFLGYQVDTYNQHKIAL